MTHFRAPYLCLDPAPTIQTVDTSNVPAHQKPIITTFTRIFNETSEPLGESRANPVWKRQLEINSRIIGTLFAQLNSRGITKNDADKIVQLCQALDNDHNVDFDTLLKNQLTSTKLVESFWVDTFRQIIFTRRTIINGPEAMRLFEKRMGFLVPSQDVLNRPIYRTVWVHTGGCSEQVLKDNFNAHGEIESVRMMTGGALITYTTREAPYKAIKKCLRWHL